MHPISVYVIYPYNLPFIVFYNKQGYNNLTSLNIGNTSIKIEEKKSQRSINYSKRNFHLNDPFYEDFIE